MLVRHSWSESQLENKKNYIPIWTQPWHPRFPGAWMVVSSFSKCFVYSTIFYSISKLEIEDSIMSILNILENPFFPLLGRVFLEPFSCACCPFIFKFLCSIFSFTRGVPYLMTSWRCMYPLPKPPMLQSVGVLSPISNCQFLQGRLVSQG